MPPRGRSEDHDVVWVEIDAERLDWALHVLFDFLLHDFSRGAVLVRVGLYRFNGKEICPRHVADGFRHASGVPGTGDVKNGNAGLLVGCRDRKREETGKRDGAEIAAGDHD